MGTFITNDREKSLKRRIQNIIRISDELKFLVGFFYFSGLNELYKTLKTLDEEGKLKKGFIKVLVGLGIDKGNYGIYESAKIQKFFNRSSLEEDFHNSLRTAFTSGELDKEETYKQIDFFIKLLSEEKLIIRKTIEPNHAKLYLFKLNENVKDVLPSLFITGSSNLTKSGLESQNEFNVEIKDYGFDEAEEYFDKLWEKAIPLQAKQIIDTIRKETFIREITPFSAYAFLVKTYLELHRGKSLSEELVRLMEEKGYKPYSYQLEAVSQALANCEAHTGTILADVVGLGKTVIACLVAKSLGKRGVVICPPHLIGDDNRTSGWKKYLADFKLWDWEVRSVGKLEEVLKFVHANSDIEVIIIDEAHRFRNERTQSYHFLKEICRGKIVILLTATPFNNRPSDLFAMLKLFTIPKKSTIVLEENLENRFRIYGARFKKLAYIKNYWKSKHPKRKKRAERYYKDIFGENYIDISKVSKEIKSLAKEIRAILEPVVIRRNRLDLKYYEEEIELSEVKDPEEWFFELTSEQLSFYDEVINSFAQIEENGKFKGAIYFPIRYEKGLPEYLDDLEGFKLSEEESFIYTSQRNLYDFMRRLLVKRFESSFGAFRESVKRFKEIHEKALEFIEKTGKFILDRKLMDSLVEEDPDFIFDRLLEYEKELEENKFNKHFYKVYDVDKFKDKERFLNDIKSDLKLFELLLQKMEEIGLTESDPKADRLVKGLEEFLKSGRKVVIFTEYLDTAKHLKNILEETFKDELLPAFGNLSKSTIKAIYKNFDAQYEEQEDKYQILLATDKLSEGFNLNRAGAVINYDIPWNPVRVIQRVGRINRIAKKVYDEIFIVNFFPTEKGADIVKSREIAQTKMFMIHSILGEDAKIFDPDEQPRPAELYRRLTTYREDEEESFFTRVRKDYENIKRMYPDMESDIKDMPNRVKVAKKGDEDEVLVFVKKGKDLFVGYKNYCEKQPSAVSFEEVYEKIKAVPDTPSLPLSENFWENYYRVFEKTAYTRFQQRGNDLAQKALNLLETILNMEDKRLKQYRKFISNLLEDVRFYGTLSEYTLSEIVKWESYLKNIDKLTENISILKGELGEDFLDRAQRFLKGLSEEVIIAIENQKGKGSG